MSQRQFRPAVVDRLGSAEPLDEVLQIIPLRSWILVIIQGVLFSIALSWAFLGRVPISVKGEGHYIGTHGTGALIAVDLDSTEPIPLGTKVTLVPRENFGTTLTGKIIKPSDAGEATVFVDLQRVIPTPRVGARFQALAVIGERNPIAWIMSGFHR